MVACQARECAIEDWRDRGSRHNRCRLHVGARIDAGLVDASFASAIPSLRPPCLPDRGRGARPRLSRTTISSCSSPPSRMGHGGKWCRSKASISRYSSTTSERSPISAGRWIALPEIPILPNMVVEGISILPLPSAVLDKAREIAQRTFSRGPPPLDAATIANRRYVITDMATALQAGRDRGTLLALGAALYTSLADFTLRAEGGWSARGKALPRALAAKSASLASEFEVAFAALFASEGNVGRFRRWWTPYLRRMAVACATDIGRPRLGRGGYAPGSSRCPARPPPWVVGQSRRALVDFRPSFLRRPENPIGPFRPADRGTVDPGGPHPPAIFARGCVNAFEVDCSNRSPTASAASSTRSPGAGRCPRPTSTRRCARSAAR